MGEPVATRQTTRPQRADPQRSLSHPGSQAAACCETSSIARLQRAVGNRAITRLLQSQTRQHSDTIQPKLNISQPEDESEREADRVGDQVMRMPEPLTSRQQDDEEKGLVQRKFGSCLQRKCNDCSTGGGACSKCAEEEVVQRKALNNTIVPIVQCQHDKSPGDREVFSHQQSSEQNGKISNRIAARINSLLGGGQPLPAATRSFFEPRFGADFSGVRIHANGGAAQVARSASAKAFTLGQDLVFGAGHYSPETTDGKKLLAHELTHVLQQGGRTQVTNQGSRSFTSIENSGIQMKASDVIQRATISDEEPASKEGSFRGAEPETEDEEMEQERESSDECETASEGPEEEAATGGDLSEESTILTAGNGKKSKPKRPGLWARWMEALWNRKGCKPFDKRKKEKKPKGQQSLARCVTKYEVNQKQIDAGRQPKVKNKETNRDFSLDDSDCIYLVRWDMKRIPDQMIITDNVTNAVIRDTRMTAGKGNQAIPGPANIHIRVVPNDGTQNPKKSRTVYEYDITAVCGKVKKITTCYWLGVIPIGRKVETVKFDPKKDYSKKESRRMSRASAKRLLGQY